MTAFKLKSNTYNSLKVTLADQNANTREIIDFCPVVTEHPKNRWLDIVSFYRSALDSGEAIRFYYNPGRSLLYRKNIIFEVKSN